MITNSNVSTQLIIPDFLSEIDDFKAINEVQNIIISNFFAAQSQVQNDLFLETASFSALAKNASSLGIPVFEQEEMIRTAIISKLSSKPPINVSFIFQIAKKYLGDTTEILYKEEEKILLITYKGGFLPVDYVFCEIYKLIPANIILSIQYCYYTWCVFDQKDITFEVLNRLNLNFAQFDEGLF